MKKLIPILLLTILSCKAKQDVLEVNKNDINTNNKCLDISIERNENLIFSIKNISNEDIFIFEFGKLKIEKYVEGKWEKLKILRCPCDAPCHAGDPLDQLSAGEAFILVWNKEQSWCGDKKEGNIRETIREKVNPGEYRIIIEYALSDKIRKSYNKKFTIE